MNQVPSRFRRRSLALIFAATGLLLLFSCASFLLNTAKRMERGRADLEESSLKIEDGHTMPYLSGGEGPTVVLLHGFGGNKDNWTRFARYLVEDYSVVIPDLPGFGEGDRNPEASYSYPAQLKRIRAFARALNLERVHVVGNSMGGALAGLYAAAYPDAVHSLALFNAAGVKSPEKSMMHRIFAETGTNPLLVNDAEDFDRFLKFTFVEPPSMPGSVKAFFAAEAVNNRAFNEKVFADIRQTPFPLRTRLRKIKAPSLVLWGDTDNIIHVSSVKVFERGLRNSRSVIMKDCGHVPMIERPEETAGHYREFLNGLGD